MIPKVAVTYSDKVVRKTAYSTVLLKFLIRIIDDEIVSFTLYLQGLSFPFVRCNPFKH